MQPRFSFKRLVPGLIVIGLLVLIAPFLSPGRTLKGYAHAEVDPQDPSRFRVRSFDYHLIIDDYGMTAEALAAIAVLKHGAWSRSTDPKRCAHEDLQAFAQAAPACMPTDGQTSKRATDCVLWVLISSFNFDPDRRREYAVDVVNEVKTRLIDLAGQ